MKIKLAKMLIDCQYRQMYARQETKCYICPAQDACDELFLLTKHKWLPAKSEKEIENLTTTIECIQDEEK